MQKVLLKKGLVFGVILLFIWISITPRINGNNNQNIRDNDIIPTTALNRNSFIYDDFENGALNKWNIISGVWEVISEGDNKVAHLILGTTPSYRRMVSVDSFNKNIIITAQLKGNDQHSTPEVTDMPVGFYSDVEGNNYYFIALGYNDIIYLAKYTNGSEELLTHNDTIVSEDDIWYNLKIKLENNDIFAKRWKTSDDEPVEWQISYSGAVPFGTRIILGGANLADDEEMSYDNITIERGEPPVYKGIYVNAWEYNDATIEQFITTANYYGGNNSLIDLVVIGAASDDQSYAMYPSTITNQSESTDRVEPFLEEMDRDGCHCILSIQPQRTNITALINEILSKYSDHSCIIGIAVDVEWKKTGIDQNVSGFEANTYINAIQAYNSAYRLFLVHWESWRLPSDRPGMTVLYDGIGYDENYILNIYKTWSQNWLSVGIYIFDKHAMILDDKIMITAPNTGYIIHEEYYIHGANLEITLNSGFGVNAVIKNIGKEKATKVEWEIHVKGGIFSGINKTVNGIIDLKTGESKKVATGFFLGFGSIQIIAKVNEMTQIADGMQLFMLSIVKK